MTRDDPSTAGAAGRPDRRTSTHARAPRRASSRLPPASSRSRGPNGSCSGAGSSATARSSSAGHPDLLIVLCFGAKWFAPYDEEPAGPAPRPGRRRTPTTGSAPISSAATTFTEMLYAGQISLKIGFAVGVLSTVVGTARRRRSPGTSAGATDQLLMRFTDLFLVVPAHRHPRHRARRTSGRPTTRDHPRARRSRLDVRRPRACAARCWRSRRRSSSRRRARRARRATRIIVRHILPNCIGPIIVNATLGDRGGDRHRIHAVVPRLRGPAAGHVVGQHALGRRGQRRTTKTYLLYFPGLDAAAHGALRELPR